MRRASKVDGNHAEIISALRKCGYSVHDTSQLGGGFPDIAVGGMGRNWFFEIKDPSKPPSQRKLTAAQFKFHFAWRGQIHKIETLEEALAVIKESVK